MTISIVIPAYNEESEIAKTLNRVLLLLTDRIAFEIIVVSNGSTDQTENIVRRYPNVVLIVTPTKFTVAKARNIGWHAASFDTIAFLDADILITQSWADEIIHQLSVESYFDNIVTGLRVKTAETPSPLESVWFDNMRHQKQGAYINSGNLITHKKVLTAIEGFTESLISGEDVEFCQKAIKASFSVQPNAKLQVHHEGYPKTLQNFYRREKWHGTGDLKNMHTFFNSKVAIFSFAIIGATVVLPITALFGLGYFLMLLATILLMNLAFIFYKFKCKRAVDYLYVFGLNYLYCFARVISITNRTKI